MSIVFLGTQVGLPPMQDDTDLREFTAQPGGGLLHVRVEGPGSPDILDHESIAKAAQDVSIEVPGVAELGAPIPKGGLQLRDYQREAVQAVFDSWKRGVRAPLVCLPTGCHAKGQLLLMADGSLRAVEDIVPGDQLMGADSSPRTVLRLCRGHGQMYEISPHRGGLPWIVNEDHVLSLQQTPTDSKPKYPSQSKGGQVVDVSVREYLQWSRWRKHIHKLFRVPAPTFHTGVPQTLPLDPYFLGISLGDGCLTATAGSISISKPDDAIWQACLEQAERAAEPVQRSAPPGRCPSYHFSKLGPTAAVLTSLGLIPTYSAQRFVPDLYRRSSASTRLSVLAGLLDTDGHLDEGGGYDFISSSRRLTEDVVFIARSLGLASGPVVEADKYNQHGVGGTYYRTYVGGAVHVVPCRIPRKIASPRPLPKNPMRTGFKIRPVGEGDFYGFTLDGDGRYLLDDFTVTHNSGKTIIAAKIMTQAAANGRRSLFIAHRKELLDQTASKIVLTAADSDTSSVGIVQASRNQLGREITIASTATLKGKRLAAVVDAGPYDIVFVDEAHHAPSKSYRKILEAVSQGDGPGPLFAGLTATPGRGDGLALDLVFDEVCYQKTVFEMIDLGYLVPFKGYQPHLDIKLDSVKTTSNGDYNEKQLSKVLNTPMVNLAMVHAWQKYGHDRKTLVFAVDVDHATELNREFNAAGYPCAIVTGSTKTRERNRVFKQFSSGELKLLINVGVATEGYDEPSIEAVMFARPTQSQALAIQMLGRGLRLHPLKSECLVIDPVGNLQRHSMVQLASLAGFDPVTGKGGGGSCAVDPDADDHDDDAPTVGSAEVLGATEITMRRPTHVRYAWRETSLGWVLLIPNIGYYLVAWHNTAKTTATIRFYDQRPGRRDEPARDVMSDPVDFQLAYGLVEGEMDRFFRARDTRKLKRTQWGGVYEDDHVREFDSKPNPEVSARHQMTFVDLDDGLSEELHVDERLMLSDAKWRERPMSGKQKALLLKLGTKATSLPATAGEASDLIGILMIERDAKMRVPPTPKQLAYLRLNGLPMAKTKGEAARLIWPHKQAKGER